jgi:hypothetical protein
MQLDCVEKVFGVPSFAALGKENCEIAGETHQGKYH